MFCLFFLKAQYFVFAVAKKRGKIFHCKFSHKATSLIPTPTLMYFTFKLLFLYVLVSKSVYAWFLD